MFFNRTLCIFSVFCLSLSSAAVVQAGNPGSFGYVGLHAGYLSLGGDDWQGETVDTSDVSYGGLLLFLQDVGDLAFGLSVSQTNATFASKSSSRIELEKSFTGVGLLIGKIDNSDANRTAGFGGFEYFQTEGKVTGCPPQIQGICDFSRNKGSAVGLLGGVLVEVAKNISFGIGGRIIFADETDNAYELFVTGGFSF